MASREDQLQDLLLGIYCCAGQVTVKQMNEARRLLFIDTLRTPRGAPLIPNNLDRPPPSTERPQIAPPEAPFRLSYTEVVKMAKGPPWPSYGVLGLSRIVT